MSMSDHEFDALVTRYLDGELSDQEHAAFTDSLRGHPARQRILIDLTLLRRTLVEATRTTAPPEIKIPTAAPATPKSDAPISAAGVPMYRKGYEPQPTRIRPAYYAIAATLLAACGLAAYLLTASVDPQPDPVDPNPPRRPIATLIHNTGGGNLTVPSGYPAEGSDYSSGEYSLSFGTAEFMLTNAVNVKLRGGSNLFMRNDMNVALTRGSASFVVPKDATGFTVHLPDKSRIVDLGTAFSVQIDDRESTSVRVTDGAVRLDLTLPDGAAMSTLAVAGDLAFVSSDPDGRPVVSFASMEDTVAIGPGADVPDATDQDDPDGDRLNVDRRPLRLPAGTYHITDWRLAVADHTQGDDGTITPMLLTGKPGAPGSYTTVWIGDAFDPTDDGEQTVTARGRFTLTQSTDVYAGFFTSRGGSAIIAHSMSGSTDHSAVFNRPSEPGQAVERFAHRGLNRTYAFAIRVIADAAARIEQDESRAPADRPSVNSPIDTPSESEATDR